MVTKPCIPTVATKANASVTPPNWASTPHSAVMIRRSVPPGRPVATAYDRRAPNTAPSTAVTADRTTELTKAETTCGWVRAVTLPRLGRLPSPRNAPMTTTSVGVTRKIAV